VKGRAVGRRARVMRGRRVRVMGGGMVEGSSWVVDGVWKFETCWMINNLRFPRRAR
jgi:hypothetical protein